MASVCKHSDGTRTIEFRDNEFKRRKIYLGKITAKAAESIKTKIEAILASKLSSQPLDTDTAQWIGKLEPKMFKKLVAIELVEPRLELVVKATLPIETLHGFLDDYLKRREKDVKSGTATFLGHTIRNLKAKFSKDKLIKDFTKGDAKDFQSFLQHDEDLSPATVVRRCGCARTIFRDAEDRELVSKNPFKGIGKGSTTNRKRMVFVPHEVINHALAGCTDAEVRLLIALARFGGLRVPSEPFLLRLEEIDWEGGRFTVHAPKTEHHEGREFRVVPIFPELRQYLEAVVEASPVKTGFVFRSLRHQMSDGRNWRAINVRNVLIQVLEKQKITPWVRLWQNLRASRHTELSDQFPEHVVTAWLGNSEKVAQAHYKMVTEDHYERAAKKPVTKPVKPVSSSIRPESPVADNQNRKNPDNREKPQKTGVLSTELMGDTGSVIFECVAENDAGEKTSESYGVKSDPMLARLISAWNRLTDVDRNELINRAESLMGDR